jgi:hypothetical protein
LFGAFPRRLENYSQRYSNVEQRSERRGTRFRQVTHTNKKKKEQGVLNQFFNHCVNNCCAGQRNDDISRHHAAPDSGVRIVIRLSPIRHLAGFVIALAPRIARK